jgi:hypothetical protein
MQDLKVWDERSVKVLEHKRSTVQSINGDMITTLGGDCQLRLVGFIGKSIRLTTW